MRNPKKVALMMLSMIALLGFTPACGEDPDDERTGIDTDSSTEGGGSDTTAVDTDPVADLISLVGNVYLLDFPAEHWGGNIGSEIGPYTPVFAFEILTVDAATGAFTARLASVKNGVQDPCNKTHTLNGTIAPVTTTTGGAATGFSTVAIDVDTIIEGPVDQTTNQPIKASATLHGFTLTGQFINQGAGYKYGVISVELDARDVYSLFVQIPSTSGEELCEKLGGMNFPCAVCTFEPASTLCMALAAEAFKANISSITLIDIPEFGAGCL
jgi:hypothetical protein